MQKSNEYHFAPIFDNGRALLSETDKFPFDLSMEENIENVIGKSFASNLEYQAHVFDYELKVDYPKLYTLLEKEEQSRALEVLYLQLEKYKARICNGAK